MMHDQRSLAARAAALGERIYAASDAMTEMIREVEFARLRGLSPPHAALRLGSVVSEIETRWTALCRGVINDSSCSELATLLDERDVLVTSLTRELAAASQRVVQ